MTVDLSTVLQCVTIGLISFIGSFVLRTSTSLTKIMAWQVGHEELDKERFNGIHMLLNNSNRKKVNNDNNS